MTPTLVLASSSPRRQDLIHHLALPFHVDPSTIDETSFTAPTPADLAVTLAAAKARDVARRHPSAVVVGADTLVELDGQVLGKPRHAADARRMLGRLAGRTHWVHSSVAVWREGATRTRLVSAAVSMHPVDAAAIATYVDSGEPMDKAGAYAAQGLGASLIAGVDGSYLAVVGLPLLALRDLLREAGIAAPVDTALLERLERGEQIVRP